MNNLNIDKNTLENLKNIIGNDKMSEMFNNITPEQIQNFSTILNSSQTTNGKTSHSEKASTSNIDIETLLKVKSIVDNMNSSEDSRKNLLNSLKPYLREEKQSKLDQYASMLNFAKVAEILNSKDFNNGK